MNTMRGWAFGAGGKLVIGGVSIRSLDEMRSLAALWNRDCVKGMEIGIVSDGPIAAHARVSGVA